MNDEELNPPIEVGDILYNQECINEGKKNDGVCKYDGFIIFVNDCSKGDIVSFRITKVLKNFGIAEQINENEAEKEEDDEDGEE